MTIPITPIRVPLEEKAEWEACAERLSVPLAALVRACVAKAGHKLTADDVAPYAPRGRAGEGRRKSRKKTKGD